MKTASKKILLLYRIMTTLPIHRRNSFKYRDKCMNWHSVTGLINYFFYV